MTTGATGQLGLALPVQGELSGTWGDTVNNGITQYTNIAIAGTLTLTGDGAVTLANTTGDASASNITSSLSGAGTVTAQFAIVKVSGTTTTKVVTGPSYSKTYVVDNASSFAVTFKASGQTGVSIAAAEKVTVVFNGTDYIKLAGTIANAAGSNTQIQFNNGGLFGASANLTWDGTTLSSTQVNITGQGTLRLQDISGGEYVGLRSPGTLSASYTLTFPSDDGTSGQALITDGSGVLSWSTAASGDVYGPASATDNALARFDGTTGKLIKDSSTLTFDGTVVNNIGASPNFRSTFTGGAYYTNLAADGIYASGTDLYLYTPTAKFISFYADASEGMRLNNIGLGIGTTSPTAKLHVQATQASMNMISTGTGNPYIDFYTSTNSLVGNIYGVNGGGVAIGTNGGTEGMRLTSTGLGIGTTSPSAKLSVVKTGDNSRISIGDTASSTYSTLLMYGGLGKYNFQLGVQNNVNNAFEITPSTATGGTTFSTPAFVLDSSGNVGIGTSSPTEKLQVNGNILAGAGGQIMTVSGAAQYGARTANSVLFLTNNSEVMRLDSSGNLGIGTSSPTQRLHLAIGSATAIYNRIQNSAGDCYLGLDTSGNTNLSADNTGNQLIFKTEAVERMRLDTSGNLGLGVTPSAWETVSAIQLKARSSLFAFSNDTHVGYNLYYTSTGYKYIATDNASDYQQTGGQHRWYTAPSGTAGNAITFTQAMTLSASSELIIDSGTGGGRLTFQPNATYNQILSTTTNFGAYNILKYVASQHYWLNASSTQAMTLDASGNLGVGTTSITTGRAAIWGNGNGVANNSTNANSQLHLVTTDSTVSANNSARITFNAGNSSQANAKIEAIRDGLDTFQVVNVLSGPLVFGTNNTERARIDSSGNFQVGFTGSQTSKVNFVQSANLPVLTINNTSTSFTDGALIIYNTRATTNSTYNHFACYNGDFTGQFIVRDSGNAVNSNNSYGAVSDVKLKENIVDASPKLADLMQVKVRNYNLINDTAKQLGVVAQELETVFPAMVEEAPDRDREGNDLGTTTKSVKYSVFVPMLIKALQELKEEFDAYKASHP